MSDQGAAKAKIEDHDQKTPLEAVADPAPKPTAPPPEVELEETDFLRMQVRRLKVSEQMTYVQSVEGTLSNEKIRLQELRTEQVNFERDLTKRLGLPLPLMAYTLDEKRGVAVLQQQMRGAMSPEMVQQAIAAQQAARAEEKPKE